MPDTTDLDSALDLARLQAWLQQKVDLAGDLRAELIAGGRSNLTFSVTDGEQRWVVRRPPMGHVLSTAHDMSREVTAMRALQATAVPVPTIVADCDDSAVIGARFYVMELVAGDVLRDQDQLEARGHEFTQHVSITMVRTLAALHSVDPAGVALADFGRADGFLARQVRRWRTQMDASRSGAPAGVTKLGDALTARVPEHNATGIMRGDYWLDNLIIAGDEVAAVIDWEMSTLGDPVTDLALLLVYQRLAEISDSAAVVTASRAPGFLSRDEILQTYVTVGGIEPPNGFGFHLGLAYFKLAAILEGIHYRFVQGQTVGEGFDSIGESVEPLLAEGIAVVTSPEATS